MDCPKTELSRRFLTATVLLEEQAREEMKVDILPKLAADTYRAVRDVLKAEGVECNISKIAAAITLRVQQSLKETK
jgi:hypothetical protein